MHLNDVRQAIFPWTVANALWQTKTEILDSSISKWGPKSGYRYSTTVIEAGVYEI